MNRLFKIVRSLKYQMVIFKLFALGLLLVSCKSIDKDGVVLKLSHAHDQNHPVHASMVYFASYLDSLSGGDIKVQIYPGAQLGKEREALELLQIGTLDITKVSAAMMENYIEDFEIFSYPYLFKDSEHFHRAVHGAVKDTMFNHVKGIKLIGLTFLDAGSRNIYTAKQEVNTPNDLNGIKLRVMQSSTMIKMAKTIGASPTPIAMAELYTALQQGMVDGAENNLPTFYASRHFEVCEYFHFTEHVFVPDILVFSEYRWNRLSEKNKRQIEIAAEKMSFYHEKIWAKAEQRALDEIKKEGINVIVPDKDKFIEASRSFYDDLSPNNPIYEYVRLIKSVE